MFWTDGRSPRIALLGVLLTLAAASCAPSAGTAQSGARPDTERPPQAKRVTAAMMGEPTAMIDRMNATQITVPGGRIVEMLANAALGELQSDGKIHALLAEATPSLENGLWKLLPDGRMETTWTIRPNTRWHDGTPLTGDDFIFTTTVDQDKELAVLRPLGYTWIEAVRAPDPRTVAVTWTGPYIDADTLFTSAFASPLPKHLLEDAYLKDKTAFTAIPYWRQEFVGTGPFRMREFTPGSSILLEANADYALGRPQLDQIEVRFIVDANTLVTNLLAGSVELTLGRGFSVENAVQLRDQWHDGRMLYRPRSWIALHPQFIGPSPAIILDLRFRQALMYGTDRQQFVDTLQGGLGGVGHAFLGPGEAEYAAVEDSAVKYEYDAARATRMIEALGYSRGSDGLFQDAAGQKLAVEIRSNGERITERTLEPLANMWTRLGVSTEPLLVPVQRIADRDYVATYPGFRLMRQPNAVGSLSRVRSNQTPLPENRFVGSNYARYTSAELDGLIDQVYATIPLQERLQVLRQTMRYFSEHLNFMGLFYDGDFMFANNRLQNITGNETEIWNIHTWDARS